MASIVEHLLQHLKTKKPSLESVHLRSDEAGCYHSNFLIAAVRDIGQRVGIAVESYDVSEPQSGKDVCERILCPLKSSVRTYCSEGHDILTASDMREALQEHPVKGATAAVSMVDESKKSLQLKKIEHFSSFHNFNFEQSGIRARKAYKIGRGKLFPYDTVYVEHQGATDLQTEDTTKSFFEPTKERELNPKKKDFSSKREPASEGNPTLFECSFPGCSQAFDLFSDLELHLDVGEHTTNPAQWEKSESLYGKIRKEWAANFASVDVALKQSTATLTASSAESATAQPLQMGWAISKTHSGSTRFSPRVKEYLTAKFEIGERTGRKADPAQVEKDMRNARNPSNERLFNSKEWLTKSQIQSFFSRLAASRRKERGIVRLSVEQEEDVECLVEDAERQGLMAKITDEVGLKHPITYDIYDLCELHQCNKLSTFNIPMLKNILSHLDICFKSKEKKSESGAKT